MHSPFAPGPRHARRRSRRRSPLARSARWAAQNASFALLALSIVAVMVALGSLMASPTRQVQADQLAGSEAQWITLRSHAPADILAAVRQSRLFKQNRSGTGDFLKDLSRLGLPVLVQQVHAGTGAQPRDCYDVPILDATGATGVTGGSGGTMGVAVAWLNPARTAISVGYIRAYDVPQRWPATVSADQAVRIVAAEHRIGMRSGASPQLVYFPFDFEVQWRGQLHWTAGGELADSPIWLVPGADGQEHFVGVDGHAYHLADLPLDPRVK